MKRHLTNTKHGQETEMRIDVEGKEKEKGTFSILFGTAVALGKAENSVGKFSEKFFANYLF